MRIRFLGAARGVTGSMHLIEAAGKRFLLDCGLFQGHREEAAAKNRALAIKGSLLDFVILSHAHIDHAGNLPTLCKSGFKGRVHATAATADLSEVMLEDSAEIQERDVEFLRKRGRGAVEPLYTGREAREITRRFVSHQYDDWIDLAPGLRLLFRDAGHIMGSATVHLEIREKGKDLIRLTFTGDLGRPHMPILRDPAPLPQAEIIITESTYGNRVHGEPGEEAGRQMKASLSEAVNRAVRQGGKLLIPAFSVGRTQNILYYLSELMDEGVIPTIKVFVDSPMSVAATEVLRRHPECFDADMHEKLKRASDPLIASHIELARTVEESKRINNVTGPAVIISASGMCEFGRILHHLARHLDDPSTVLGFVGYQAEHTLGRRIIEGSRSVRIYGENVPVRASVVKLNGFSAHADKEELIAALRPLKDTSGHTVIVHGEPEQSLPFASTLEGLGFRGVIVPAEGDELVP